MNIAVFASGRGSNFQAILSAIHNGSLPVRVSFVLSNNSGAGALETARSHGIPAYHRSQRQFATEEELESEVLRLLESHNVEMIALAGYMKKLGARTIERYRNRIVNIHPALLPDFGGPGMYGIHVHEAVIASGARVSGATVHLVDEEYDRGTIVLQQTVDVAPGETPESLAAKVLVIEHEIYPKALKAFAEGRVHLEGRKVWIQQQ
jgi:phosphoribosylglycinamide formyltransferase-1